MYQKDLTVIREPIRVMTQIPRALVERIDALAQRRAAPRSFVIREALLTYVDEQEKSIT